MSDLYRKTCISIEKNKDNINKLKLIYRKIFSYHELNNYDEKYDLFKKFIKYGVNINFTFYGGQSILHNNCKNTYDVKFIKMIIDNGSNVNMCDDDGNSALHLLLQYPFDREERIKIAKILIENGLDILIVNKKGHTAFIPYDFNDIYHVSSSIRYQLKIIKIYDNYLKTKKGKYEFAQLACFNTNKSEFSKFFKLECGIRKFVVKKINTYL